VANYIVAPIVHSELREIWFFIAEDNPEAATQVVDAAERTFELLAQNPVSATFEASARKLTAIFACVPSTVSLNTWSSIGN